MKARVSGPGYLDTLGRTRGWSLADKLAHRSIPEPNSGCHLWLASTAGGYGRLRIGNGSFSAHRLAWELRHGPVPSGLFVCHKCDVRSCINPDHMFLGTNAENNADMNRKGRHVACPGERNGCARISKADAIAIYRATGLQRLIAERFNVSCQLVSAIKCGVAWRSISQGEA